MDWTNNGQQPRPAQPAPAGGGATNNKRKKLGGKLGGMKLATVALLVSGLVLLLGAAYFLTTNKMGGEGRFVNDDKLQAVFLNGGQVYFGKIQDLNSDFVRMNDIYYLRVNQTVQPDQQGNQQASANDISLVKLGCELHGPQDEMLINREQVIFWENLKDDGQVAQAVAEYVKANPNGQDCSTNNAPQSGQQSPATGGAAGTQPAGSGNNESDTEGTNGPSN